MKMRHLLVTGSSGLIGSEIVAYFAVRGWTVCGLDNNMRAEFFGSSGDTRWNRDRLRLAYSRFVHHEVDVRNRSAVFALVDELRPAAIVHAAAQPSHDLAASRPFDDFDVNAVGTLNLLEAARQLCPDSPFVHMSTNKVYGDAPNEMPLRELKTRWDYADARDQDGVNESCRIDQSLHSLFGAPRSLRT
jgi:CDP-paratose 2-epimerase